MSEKEMNCRMGLRIKEIRQAKDMTQKEFADSLGIVQGFLSGVERGKKNVSDTLIIALCHSYGINKEWLKTGHGEKFRELQIERHAPQMCPFSKKYPKIFRIFS
ncbi:helix-turn-helix domain-containing protein [Geotalea toluenoxydans]|uniref:helix-turn-helix domain-containing protein n=1 Tax=Geotalea toluenoxydans TaxID=421624 RepID=UPI000A680C00|nr:helix-turn-helix transcriptional regulator [Geotalea toluenoxydans]